MNRLLPVWRTSWKAIVAPSKLSGYSHPLWRLAPISQRAASNSSTTTPPPQPPPPTPVVADSIHLLDIRVGLVMDCTKHPMADSLLVEQVDVGDGKLTANESTPSKPVYRTIVSGLARYYYPEELKVK